MSKRLLSPEMMESLSREVEKTPLSSSIESFLGSLEIAADEKAEIHQILETMRFKDDGIQALPSQAPRIDLPP